MKRLLACAVAVLLLAAHPALALTASEARDLGHGPVGAALRQAAGKPPKPQAAAPGGSVSASQQDEETKGLLASLKELLENIRKALSMTALLDALTGWAIDVVSAPARLFGGPLGTIYVTVPPGLSPAVRSLYGLGLVLAVPLMAFGLGYAGWILMSGSVPKRDQAAGRTPVEAAGRRVLAIVAAAVLGANTLGIADFAVRSLDAAVLNTAMAKGLVPPPPAPNGCGMPTPDQALARDAALALDIWSGYQHACGWAVVDEFFGPLELEKAAGTGGEAPQGASLKDIPYGGGIIVAALYSLIFTALALLLLARNLILWLLASFAPVWLALGGIGSVEALVGLGNLFLRTLTAPLAPVLAVLAVKEVKDGSFSGLGVGGVGDVQGTDEIVVGIVAFALSAWALWKLWVPAVRAGIADPVTLGGGAVLAGVASLAESVSGKMAGFAGALGSAPWQRRLARAADAFGRARQEGEAAMRAAEAGRSLEYLGGVPGRALEAATAPRLPEVRVAEGSVTRHYAPVRKDVWDRDPLGWSEALRDARRTAYGFNLDEVAALLSAGQRETRVVRDAQGGERNEELVSFRLPEPVRHAARSKLTGLVPSFSESGDRIFVPAEHAEAAKHAVREAVRDCFGEPTPVREAAASVAVPAELADEFRAHITGGMVRTPFGPVQGFERWEVTERLEGGKVVFLVPPDKAKDLHSMTDAFIGGRVQYWTAPGGRFVVLDRGVPYVTGVQPPNGFPMGPWRGWVPQQTPARKS